MVSDASPPTIAPRSPSPPARAPRRGVPVATLFRGFPSPHEEFPGCGSRAADRARGCATTAGRPDSRGDDAA